MTTYNGGNNFAAGGYDGIISLWEIARRRGRSNLEEGLIELNCIKIIQNKYYIYNITALPTKRPALVVVDSHKKIKVLDPTTFMYISESDRIVSSEPILDMMTIEI